MIETWRPILLGKLNQPSNYEVSDLGQVRNVVTGRHLKPYRCPAHSGIYLKVDLRYQGRRYQRFVHRLVALAFVPNPTGKSTVNHEDDVRSHCEASNLSWMTKEEQEAHKALFRHPVSAEALA